MTAEHVDILCQVILVFTGCGSLYLMASQQAEHRMWAALIGLLGEPFWLTTAFINGQWGVVALACVYGASWFRVFLSNRRAYNANR